MLSYKFKKKKYKSKKSLHKLEAVRKIEFIIFRDFNSNTLSLDKTTDDMIDN